MNDFALYFNTGIDHILGAGALDHILFITVLAVIYLPEEWKKVLILVTAFTIGHSLTLALSVLDIVRFSNNWVEFLIPCTIVFTAITNLIIKDPYKRVAGLNYLLALAFGLIHGMGFANTIRFMIAGSQSIALPLISFNLGLEAGQIILVGIILFGGYLLVKKMRVKRNWWIAVISASCLVAAGWMAAERWPANAHKQYSYIYSNTSHEENSRHCRIAFCRR